jgi:hypothetical protein
MIRRAFARVEVGARLGVDERSLINPGLSIVTDIFKHNEDKSLK